MSNQQFRNLDRPAAPQVVTVAFSRVLEPDHASAAPDTMDEGFWPSRNPDAAGYVAPENFDTEMRKAKRRMSAWQRGAWQYVGVICRATVSVPIGQGSFTLYTIDSAGLWGIESNAGAYLGEVYAEQKAELIAQLRTMGAAFVELPDGE